MLVIKPDSEEAFEYPYPISEKDSVLIRFVYRPPIWEANKAYIEKRDIIIPSVFNGFQYPCNSGGFSGATEPTWGHISKEITSDNQADWKAEPYDYLLLPGMNITASEFDCDGATLLTPSFTNDYAEVQTNLITAGVSQLVLSNLITYGTTDLKIRRTIIIPVKAQR